MGYSCYVIIYFIDVDSKVIERIVINSHKYETISKFVDIMPAAKSVKVCFYDENNECDCHYCSNMSHI